MEKLSAFVGRNKEVGIIEEAIRHASIGKGNIIFLEGEAGMGKTSLLQILETAIKSKAELRQSHFAYSYCYEDTGAQNAFHPFLEILEILLKNDTDAKGVTKATLSVIKEIGPDWFNLLPGIGPAISVGVKTVSAISRIYADSTLVDQSKNLISQYTKIITKVAPSYNPLVIVIEDAHWMDSSSCRLLLRLAREVGTLPIVLIITYRPSYINELHPLLSTRNEIMAKGSSFLISLDGLTQQEISTYIINRFGNTLDPNMSGWFFHLCRGLPIFVTHYLSLLEQKKIITHSRGRFILDGKIKYRGGKWELSGKLLAESIPTSIEMLLEQRISRLFEEEKELLKMGSVQGEEFMSVVLSNLIGQEEIDILRKMQKVIDQYHIVGIVIGSELKKSELYAFEHALIQQAFYKKLSPRERVIHHGRIAKILEFFLQEVNIGSRKLVLEVGHHFDMAQDNLNAAKYFLLSAQSLFSDGALSEATEICTRALNNIRLTTENYHLHAEIVELFLIITENHWKTLDTERNLFNALAIVDEGIKAAKISGDQSLSSRLLCLRGLVVLYSRNLTEGVSIMQDSLQLAQQSNDPISEFTIMSTLGYWMRSGNFMAGLKMQWAALSLYNAKIENSIPPPPLEVRRRIYALQRQLGIGEFDQGNYGKALELLGQSVLGTRQIKAKDDLITLLNNLAQIYTAIGFFQEAEFCLREAILLNKELDTPHIWQPYNLASLGKLFLEWGRIDDAVEPIVIGLKESEITQITWELPLIRTIYAELLMSPLYSKRNLGEAEYQLDNPLNESEKYGLNRSAIVALSLKSLVYLYQNNVKFALTLSEQAVERLENFGNLPAIRREEVFFTHYQINKEANQTKTALKYLEKAYNIVKAKAISLNQLPQKESFLHNIPLNVKILSATKVMFNQTDNSEIP